MLWYLPRLRCASVVVGVVMIALASGLARAQGGVVTGVLVDTLTREPVAGAQVRASESTRGVVTDAAGRFRLTNLPGTTATLVVTAVGYRPLRTVADVGSTNLRLEMTKVVVALDQLIVTGTAGVVERRAIGNSVTTLDAERQLELAPVPDVASLINGRAPGVLVMPGSGQVGAGPTIRARGVKSFSLNTNPLVYVDGVRADNEIGSGSAVQGGSGVINRLNDFSPEEIESIEIIKGPAAATLYGTEASNGVIQIITRRGSPNAPPKFAFTARQGATWFVDPEGRIAPNWAVDSVTRDTFSLDLFASERARGNKIFGTGHVQGFTGSVRGGAETVRYFASADVDLDDGIEPTNYQRRLGIRGNLIITPSEKIDVSANLGLSRGHTQLACEGACGRGVWLSLIMGDPLTRDGARRGFGVAPPEVLWSHFDTFQDLDRSQAALHFMHRPTTWFSHRLVVGEDRTHEDNEDIVQRDDTLAVFPFLAGLADGQKAVSRRDVTMTTVDYSATSSVPLSRWADGVTSTTTLGMQYQHRLTRLVGATGNQFPAPGLETISSTASTAGSDAFVENNTLGFFAQQQFSYRGRLYLTGALRADDNSAFGKNFDIVYYPKISAAWVLHEEPWWRVPHFDALRLRFAYGAAGQQPQDFASLRSYAPVTAGTGVPAITPQLIGNDSLAPERGEEVEAGFEAAFLNQRIGVDFTYYAARTRDAILLRNLAPSLGFNSGVEDGFEIYRTEIFDQIKVTLGRVAANVTAFRDDAVVTGRIYSYEVAATRDGGVSYIPAPSVTETTNGPPAAPTITASPQDGFVVVSWALIGGAQWYRIERSIDGGSTWIEAGTTGYAWQTESWDEPFIIEQQLCYRVFAINSKGASATASNVACTIPVAAPTDVNATWNGNVVAAEVEVRWTDNSSWEDGYQIIRYPGLPQNEGWDLIAELPPNATSFRDAGFWTSGSHSYYVRAKKGGGGSYSINVYVWVGTSGTGGAGGAIGALRSRPIKAPAMRASSPSGQGVRREVPRPAKPPVTSRENMRPQ